MEKIQQVTQTVWVQLYWWAPSIGIAFAIGMVNLLAP